MSEPRILLVEDDAGMAQMLVAYLGRKDYRVTPVADGERARKMLAGPEPFDLVLTDIRMPGASGMEVLRAAREQESPPTVVLMTAYASVENVIEAMEAGAYAYIRKPFMDLDHDVGQVVERALAERRLAAENRELMRKLKSVSAQLYRRQKELDSQLEMASHIQRSLLPDELVKIQRTLVATRRFLGEELSGDFFDAIPLPEGAVGLVAGQAIGRDIPAAILMASIAGHLRELARRYVDPVAVIDRANEAIYGILERGYENFVSVFYGVIAPNRSKIEYTCAAHPAPVHIRFSRPAEELPRPDGPFLGKYREGRYGVASAPLVKDDRLVLFSENIPHVENASGNPVSVERLGKWAEAFGMGRTSRAVEDLGRRLEEWAADDMRRQNGLLMIADML